MYPFIVALRDLRNVVDSCFGIQLHPSSYQMIERSKKSFITLKEYCMKFEVNLSITWKLHILFVYVEQFYSIRKKNGLGAFSEQVTEGVRPMPPSSQPCRGSRTERPTNSTLSSIFAVKISTRCISSSIVNISCIFVLFNTFLFDIYKIDFEFNFESVCNVYVIYRI